MKFQYFQYFQLFSAILDRVELRLVSFDRGHDSLQNSVKRQFLTHMSRLTRTAIYPKITDSQIEFFSTLVFES